MTPLSALKDSTCVTEIGTGDQEFRRRVSTSMKGPSLSRHTASERARTAYAPSVRARSIARVPGLTIHHRMPERLTYSFKHLFELARELSIS